MASLYFSDRLCDFTLGIVGLPVAVAIFPLLCRHADRGDHRQMGADMTLGLRLVLCLSIPAGVGLMLLARADHAADVASAAISRRRTPFAWRG